MTVEHVSAAYSLIVIAFAIYVSIYATKPNRSADARTDAQWAKQETENQRLREMVAKLHAILAASRSVETEQASRKTMLESVDAIANGTSQPRPVRGPHPRQPSASIGIDENLEG